MSRSYKKPYITDQQNSSQNIIQKRAANKVIRKMPINQAPANGKQYRKEYCSWSIRDFSFHCPANKKAYRK